MPLRIIGEYATPNAGCVWPRCRDLCKGEPRAGNRPRLTTSVGWTASKCPRPYQCQVLSYPPWLRALSANVGVPSTNSQAPAGCSTLAFSDTSRNAATSVHARFNVPSRTEAAQFVRLA